MRAPRPTARRVLAGIADAAAEATIAPSFSRAGIALRRRLEAWDDLPSMRDQVAVVTGATSGIGLAAAIAMAKLGASLHLVGRDLERATRARAAVEVAGLGRVEVDIVDLADLDAATTFGLRLTERYETLNVLVHNAGALTREYKTTPAGVELTVATQVLGPYVLTAALAPLLWDGSPATIVTVSSGGMYTQRFDLGRLEMTSGSYDGAVAYARCKRAQVVLASAWAGRFGPSGVASYSMHPGWVNTPGLKAGLPRFEALWRPLLRTPAEGADTVVWLAAGGPASQAHSLGRPVPVSGFFHDRRRRREQRFPVVSPMAPGDLDVLLEWCALRTGIVTPLPPAGRG
ncbi:MAG: SDR family NAD(P)-dependent oxidoreductase [Acidimicrobiales bacterium]|jgi:NAD(P)-dependent dehydrogenase (short-subunit alcohol dehydrogenase family)